MLRGLQGEREKTREGVGCKDTRGCIRTALNGLERQDIKSKMTVENMHYLNLIKLLSLTPSLFLYTYNIHVCTHPYIHHMKYEHVNTPPYRVKGIFPGKGGGGTFISCTGTESQDRVGFRGLGTKSLIRGQIFTEL